MKKWFCKFNFFLLFTLFLFSPILKSQAQFIPIYHFSSKYNSWYDDGKHKHSSLQPYYESDSNSFKVSNKKSWVKRKLFEEELIKIQYNNSRLLISYLPDFSIGTQQNENRFLWNNTRGFEFKGDVNSKFTFGLQIYENQTVFPTYLDSLFERNQTVFGQVWTKSKDSITNVYDYSYSTAHIAYRTGNFTFHLANDKMFIGDGYRSLLLSDVAVPYPYFKVSFENDKLQYASIYMQHIDPSAPILSADLSYRRKWAVMHFLDWNISKKLTLGFFDAVVWQDDDSSGKRGFEMSYVNPIIFLRTAEYNTNSTDNALVGLNLKYQLTKNTKVYGQLLLDELKIDEYFKNTGWWANKFGMQLGVKSKDIFQIENLNGFTEFNLVKPYTYAHNTSLRSYSHFNDALAHPLGSNFWESVSRLEYSIGNWSSMVQINYAQYGLDSISGTNVGKDILLSYVNRDKEYGNKLLQGIPASFVYIDARLGYVINPKTNLRLEIGYIFRNEKIAANSQEANMITFGLKSSFRNLYFDR